MMCVCVYQSVSNGWAWVVEEPGRDRLARYAVARYGIAADLVVRVDMGVGSTSTCQYVVG